ncbi:MAG TPA: hypothetical protein VHR72_09015 [Gemmataceae bacterium]|jgi:hypothetical protein|nr:hypothetical protein [Gemmataceae bacterium]
MRSFLFLASFAVVSLRCMGALDAPEEKQPPPKLRIELKTTTPKVGPGVPLLFTADLVNDGKTPVTVVLPGDGSESGWRTPILRWKPAATTKVLRCGNINALKPGEVIQLAPGKRVSISEWIGGPPLSGPGKYAVSLELENVPDLKWNGKPLGKHDPATMEKVRSSLPFKAVSNVVEIEMR